MRKRHILTAFLMTAALSVALAWAASFAGRDFVWVLGPKGGAVVSSNAGKVLVLLHTHPNAGWDVQHQGLPGEGVNRIDPPFQFHVCPALIHATCPHWFLLLLFGLPLLFYAVVRRGTDSQLVDPWVERTQLFPVSVTHEGVNSIHSAHS